MLKGLEQLSPVARGHLIAFKRELEDVLPNRVARVTLFGSRARGDAEEHSDYDVAVFLRDLDDRSDLDPTEVVSSTAYDHLLAGIDISAIVLPERYLDDPTSTELAFEISRDGIVLP